MKQFQLAYKNDESFLEELEEIKQWCEGNPSYATVFRIYSEDMDIEHVKHVCDILDEKMPDALYLGCTTNGNIMDGALSKAKIMLSCTVFEYETTEVELLQFSFKGNVEEDVRRLKEYCDANPWVSAVEIHATVIGTAVPEFCERMNALRPDIQVFGGGTASPDMGNVETFLFSKGYGFVDKGIIFFLMGGKDFHTYSTYISGWKSLKRKFRVTKARGPILYELDGEPAFNIYKKFLNIDKNRNLVANTLEFPLLLEKDGIDMLRCLVAVNDDNSVVLTAGAEENTDVRLAYGDPRTILSSIRRDGRKIAEFHPEAIQIFSCASRKAFWREASISDETRLFQSIAPTSGFYTGGEFLRAHGLLCHFNITLVIIAMREGEPKEGEIIHAFDAKLDDIAGERIPLIGRFVSFINASTAELEDLNRKLAIVSITDGLTKLYNRSEIERRIRHTVEERTQNKTSGHLSLIMLDIDDFKKVNDAYGHKEGDTVLMALSDVLRKTASSVPSSSVGRWGGEEFMILLPESDMGEAAALAEKIRAEFASLTYEKAGSQTVSIGVIQAQGEDVIALCKRVDQALYMAKANGKNQVVRL